MGERPDFRSESILDSNQIDSEIDSEIDSDLILEGRTEMRIDNRIFSGCSKGSQIQSASQSVSLAASTPGGNRFGFEPNRFSNRFSPNHQWYDLIWESIFDFFLAVRTGLRSSQSVSLAASTPNLFEQSKKIEDRFQISVLPSRIR